MRPSQSHCPFFMSLLELYCLFLATAVPQNMCQIVFSYVTILIYGAEGRDVQLLSSVEDSQAYDALHFRYLQSAAIYLSLNRKSTIQKSCPLPATQKSHLMK